MKGITGSGKTEIYIKLIEDCLKSLRNAIILVPEINLAPALKNKILQNFDCEIAILNSGLKPSERYEEYRKIAENKVRIVIGTRSAIFAPLTNIGLIVMDEEFSDFYKNANAPYYDTVEIAKFRSSYNKSKLLLVSATPSFEAMARAKKGVYHLVELKNRYNEKSLPSVKIINMCDRKNIVPGHSLISKDLIMSLELTLKENNQALILVNKRGYSSRIECNNCGNFVSCDTCENPMFYHKKGNFALCHHCYKKIDFEKVKCPVCGGRDFTFIGTGTEKIFDELKVLFSNKRIEIFDSDNANNEEKISKILDQFSKQEIDILVGTEMIAKGHNFPSVTLVAIVDFDSLLESFSYQTSEHAFDLVTQTVGRSGRNDQEGVAIIQTTNIENPIVKLGASQDYDLFFEREMKFRKLTSNPPYFYVDKIDFSSTNFDKLSDTVDKIYYLLKSNKNIDFKIVKSKILENRKTKICSLTIKHKSREETLKIYNTLFKNNSELNGVDFDLIIDYKD